MLGLDRDSVAVVPYDESWKEEFEKERKILQQVLGEYALRIEHVGSTSIEGLPAKPILDVAVGVKDVEALRAIVPVMEQAGYDVKEQIEDKDEVLAHRGPATNRTHHIHVMVNDSDRCISQILFRDYLRLHPEAKEEYKNLKLFLAQKYAGERVMYTSSKHDFIQGILKKAKQELI